MIIKWLRCVFCGDVYRQSEPVTLDGESATLEKRLREASHMVANAATAVEAQAVAGSGERKH